MKKIYMIFFLLSEIYLRNASKNIFSKMFDMYYDTSFRNIAKVTFLKGNKKA